MNHVKWQTPWHGLEALLNGRNLALGLSVLFLARTNGLLYLINSVDDDDLHNRSVNKVIINSVAFLAFFLLFIITLLLSDGYALNGDTGLIEIEKNKYLSNFIRMPYVLIFFLAGVCAVLYGIGVSVFRGSRKGIWYTGSGTVLAVLALLLIAGLNRTSFYPSSFDPGSSLTIQNASSSFFTLKTMMFVSFIIPFVAGYIWYAWKAINNKKITEEEMKEEGHVY
jgi:cytochrome d ubiquinol oxidase subunit II